MSAFLCSQKHFQFIADNLAMVRVYEEDYRDFENIKQRTIKDVNEMMELNKYALTCRYDDAETFFKFNELKKIETINKNEFDGIDDFTLIQLIKALDCLHYQCSEGDAYKLEAMDYLNSIRVGVDKTFMRKNSRIFSQEYEQANWEIV